MFTFLNIFYDNDNTEDDTILTSNDSLAEKNNEDYTILYSKGTKSIVGITDKNLLSGFYRNHLLELIIVNDSGDKLSLVKSVHNSYTNNNIQIFIINNINKIIPYINGKMLFTIKPSNIIITDEQIQRQLSFNFKLNKNAPENSFITIEENNIKLVLFIKVIDNIYSIKELEYHIQI